VLKQGFIRQAPNYSTAELPLLIAPMSSPTIGYTNVVGSAFVNHYSFYLQNCLFSE
jgi:hypothetical protein